MARVFAASSSARTGRYVREDRLDEHTSFIHWVGEVAGHAVESLELITDDDAGLVVERTVAFRPFPAIALFRSAVHPVLKDVVGPEFWTYEDTSLSVELDS